MAPLTTVLITGANRGLGYYAAQQLAATGKYQVLLGSRSLSNAEKAISELAADTSVKLDPARLEPVEIDVSSDASIAKAAETVSARHGGALDVLVNNAGIAQAQEGGVADGSLRATYAAHFDSNVFGAAVTTQAFLPLLRKGSGKRITFTSSGLSSFEWTSTGRYPAAQYPVYRSTKPALDMIMLHYADLLAKEGFVVAAADPGYCATNLNHFNGLKDPRLGAAVLVKVITAPKEEVHAARVDVNGKTPW